MDEIDISKICEFLNYNPETGEFVWKKRLGNRRPGHLAGSFNKSTKVFRVGIFGVYFCGNYLAFLMTSGRYPTERLRYRDGNPCNNRLANIEVVHDQLKRGPPGLTKLEVFQAPVVKSNCKFEPLPKDKLKPAPAPEPPPAQDPDAPQYPGWMMMRP